MSEFDECFADGFEAQLTSFGEQLVYRPVDGPARPVIGVVNRNPIAPIKQAPGDRSPRIEITFRNDQLCGVASEEFDSGGDRVDVAFRHGGKIEPRSMTKLLKDWAGITVIEVR